MPYFQHVPSQSVRMAWSLDLMSLRRMCLEWRQNVPQPNRNFRAVANQLAWDIASDRLEVTVDSQASLSDRRRQKHRAVVRAPHAQLTAYGPWRETVERARYAGVFLWLRKAYTLIGFDGNREFEAMVDFVRGRNNALDYIFADLGMSPRARRGRSNRVR